MAEAVSSELHGEYGKDVEVKSRRTARIISETLRVERVEEPLTEKITATHLDLINYVAKLHPALGLYGIYRSGIFALSSLASIGGLTWLNVHNRGKILTSHWLVVFVLSCERSVCHTID